MNLLRKSYLLAFAAMALVAIVCQSSADTAVPAPTLTSPASPEKPPGAGGFIQRWLLLEPIPVTGLTDSAVQATVKKEYFPDQFTVLPRDGDKVKAGDVELTWHAVD